MSGDPYGALMSTAYDNLILDLLKPSPIMQLWAEEAKQREASLSRAFKLHRRIRRRWDRSRFWLSNAIYKHEESEW